MNASQRKARTAIGLTISMMLMITAIAIDHSPWTWWRLVWLECAFLAYGYAFWFVLAREPGTDPWRWLRQWWDNNWAAGKY